VLTQHGVPIAPSTYYAVRHRPLSALRRCDVELTELIRTVHAGNYGVYGYRKVWYELTRRGGAVGRETVARLMRAAGVAGVSRSKSTRTTRPAATAQRPADLLERDFTAAAPNSRWVADISYVWTWTGFVDVAFVTDLFSRRIIGWRAASSLRTDLALDALEHGLWQRAACPRSVRGAMRCSLTTPRGVLDRRPQLDKVLERLRSGDTLVVCRLDRLGRSLRHLIDSVTALGGAGCRVPVTAGVDRHDDRRWPAGVSPVRCAGCDQLNWCGALGRARDAYRWSELTFWCCVVAHQLTCYAG